MSKHSFVSLLSFAKQRVQSLQSIIGLAYLSTSLQRLCAVRKTELWCRSRGCGESPCPTFCRKLSVILWLFAKCYHCNHLLSLVLGDFVACKFLPIYPHSKILRHKHVTGGHAVRGNLPIKALWRAKSLIFYCESPD